MKKLFLIVMLCISLVLCSGAMADGLQEKGFDYYVEDGKAVVSGYQGTDTSIVVPSTLGGYEVTKLDYECFAGQDMFVSVTLPDTLRVIGWTAFAGCENLRSIVIPAGVTEIGRYAFSGCTSLSSVTLPDSLVNLRRYAFDGCSSLTELVIPANVTEIPGNTLDGTSLRKLTIMGKDTTFTDVPAYVMLERFGMCKVYCWEGSWADERLAAYDSEFPLYYLTADSVAEANPIKVTDTADGNVDPDTVTQDNVPSYVPTRAVKEPTLILTSGADVTGKTESGEVVDLAECFVIHEVHLSREDVIMYDLSVRTEEGEYVTVKFDPPQPLLLPYPTGVSYDEALLMEFTVEHGTSVGPEYFSTKTGNLIRTKGGLLLYTSSFSPFTLTWEEGGDPAELPKTGDESASVAMLMGLIVLSAAACFVLRRRTV